MAAREERLRELGVDPEHTVTADEASPGPLLGHSPDADEPGADEFAEPSPPLVADHGDHAVDDADALPLSNSAPGSSPHFDPMHAQSPAASAAEDYDVYGVESNFGGPPSWAQFPGDDGGGGAEPEGLHESPFKTPLPVSRAALQLTSATPAGAISSRRATPHHQPDNGYSHSPAAARGPSNGLAGIASTHGTPSLLDESLPARRPSSYANHSSLLSGSATAPLAPSATGTGSTMIPAV